MRTAVVALLLLGARGGCGPSGGTSNAPQTNDCAGSMAPPADGMPVVHLMRDAVPFAPIVDGDILPLNFGPQGGQHVYVTVELYTAKAMTWTYKFTFDDENGQLAGSTSVGIDACAGWNHTQKVRVFMQTSASHTGPLTISAQPETGGAPLTQTVNVKVSQ